MNTGCGSGERGGVCAPPNIVVVVVALPPPLEGEGVFVGRAVREGPPSPPPLRGGEGVEEGVDFRRGL